MKPVSTLRRREVKTYFDVISKGGSDRLIAARSFHNLGEWEGSDYEWLSTLLRDVTAHSSFSFLGREANRYAETIEMLDRAGHEIVLHGHRHLACDDIPYDLVHENIERGLTAIEDAAGVSPRGFIAPRQTVNGATLRVLDELDFSWVLGTTEAEIPDNLAFKEPQYPYDLLILNNGATPAETFDRLRKQTADGVAHLVHPNMVDYYDGRNELRAWIIDTQPTTISNVLSGNGIGLICDAMRPLRIE